MLNFHCMVSLHTWGQLNHQSHPYELLDVVNLHQQQTHLTRWPQQQPRTVVHLYTQQQHQSSKRLESSWVWGKPVKIIIVLFLSMHWGAIGSLYCRHRRIGYCWIAVYLKGKATSEAHFIVLYVPSSILWLVMISFGDVVKLFDFSYFHHSYTHFNLRRFCDVKFHKNKLSKITSFGLLSVE